MTFLRIRAKILLHIRTLGRYTQNPVLGNAIPRFECETKTGWYFFGLFFKIGLRPATSFKKSRRELYTDVAKHRSMFKKY